MAARDLLERGPAMPSKSSPMLRCPNCDTHFFEGGEVEYDREHAAEMRQAERTRQYDKDFDHYYHSGEAGFARGGRVDGAGKVDGIHRSPRECGHLAAGGVCRHYAKGGEVDEDVIKHRSADDAEDRAEYQRMVGALEPTAPKRIRQETTPRARGYAMGGSTDSFAGYLAKRRDARRALRAG